MKPTIIPTNPSNGLEGLMKAIDRLDFDLDKKFPETIAASSDHKQKPHGKDRVLSVKSMEDVRRIRTAIRLKALKTEFQKITPEIKREEFLRNHIRHPEKVYVK